MFWTLDQAAPPCLDKNRESENRLDDSSPMSAPIHIGDHGYDHFAAISVEALNTSVVTLTGVRRAGDVTEAVGRRHFLHAGPPIELSDITGPMRGAIIGGLIFEGEAADEHAAAAIIDSGKLTISPCHDAGGVGAMAGIITPNMPVVVATCSDRTTFSGLNEGTGGAVRYGSFDAETIGRLHWITNVMAPALDAAIQAAEPIDLVTLVAEGLRRGDDCHNRLAGTTSNLLCLLAAELTRQVSREDAAATMSVMAGNPHFALPFAISMGKALAMSAADVPGSPVVTAMAANGREFGIRVSGTGDRWFTAPSPIGTPQLLPGLTLNDVNPTMGDSMIAETAGFGAFAMSAAPAIMSFIGGTASQGIEIVEEMRSITVATSSRFLLPNEDHRGTPLGIDVHRVASSGVAPIINNGLAHREMGRGRAGAGVTRVPIECFIAASDALAKGLRRS